MKIPRLERLSQMQREYHRSRPCAPLEVRKLAAVAALARRLILGKKSLAKEFPSYKYGRAEWLAERIQRDANKIADTSHAVA